MNIYEDTNPRELKELLRQIYTGETVLPDFQRDFVWEPNMTTELIISIAENYPAGSLLRIRNTHNLFAYREFEGAPPVNGKKPTYLILDGQQRLTSLYQAFYGVGENRYYLNVSKLYEGKDFEDCIFNLKADHKKIKEYEDPEVQAKELILPLSVLKGGAGKYTTWLLSVAAKAKSDDERLSLQDGLLQLGERWIQTIDDYRFPVVTLSDSTNADAVCTIFETLNRTGVKLSPFELLTARFWPQGLNLRQLWIEAKEKYPIISDFDIDPYYLLQIISLLSREKPSVKRSDVMELEKKAIIKNWDKAVEGLKNALEHLQNNCGVLTPNLLPYNTIVIPTAAIFARTLSLTGPKVGAARDKISRWFWCAVFGQKYESSPTSQSATDYQEVVRWINGGEAPEAVTNFDFDPVFLRETTGRQRAIYRGTLAAVLRNQARDFHSHNILTLAVINQGHVDDHHIFPNKYLEKRSVPSKQRDCVLNHTLIDRATNIRISDRSPSDYMQEILIERGDVKFDELLASHLLPTNRDAYLMADDFAAFLDWRQEKVWHEIKRLTGI